MAVIGGVGFWRKQNGLANSQANLLLLGEKNLLANTPARQSKSVSIMANPKAAPAARVSALLDRGYGKPPQHQHITGADGPQYVVRLPVVCETVEEWVAQCS